MPREMVSLRCVRCGAEFTRARKDTYLGRRPEGGKFCSRTCAKRPPAPLEERFRERVERGAGCWEWRGSRVKGYGTLLEAGRLLRAHRISWELHFGAIPEGLGVLHSCDNPGCVNPAHLFLGTNTDNAADMVQKGRQAKGEHHGLSRLTAQQAREIRQLAAAGASQRALAARFGVSRGCVRAVLENRTWTDAD